MSTPASNDDSYEEERLAISYMQQHSSKALPYLLSMYAEPLEGLLMYKFDLAPEDTEEILQDTFVKALRFGHRYDPARGKLITWLFVIAQSITLTRRRKRETIGTIPLQLVARNLCAGEINTQAPLVEIPSDTMEGILLQLLPIRAFVIRMHFYGNYSVPILAELLSISEKAVQAHLRRAQDDMKKLLCSRGIRWDITLDTATHLADSKSARKESI